MRVWAIADLHLSFGVPEKSMEVFGWKDYAEKIEKNWREVVQEDDLVLVAGDISWAMKLDEAKKDLEWIAQLPGTKVMIKGNHDHWWSSLSKVQQALPSSVCVIQNNAFYRQGIAIGGARLWDSDEYNFDACIDFKPKERSEKEKLESERIFKRELERLEMSLKALPDEAKVRIAMTHYPPVGLKLFSSKASALLEKYGVSICVFGHLHNVKTKDPLFGTARGVTYYLTSCDYLNFQPLHIYSSAK
jgi:uncharacterized protein